jgi:hypothetical protein
VSAASRLNAFWWCYLARPKSDRAIYRLIRKHKPRKLMLLGLGDLVRPVRMISLAQRYSAGEPIQLGGVDRFEARPAGHSKLSLKDAHRLLRPTGGQIHLFPGDPHEALGRAANILHDIELVVIAADQDAASLARAWFFINRLLAPQALVLREEIAGDTCQLKSLPRVELERLGAAAAPARRRAA